jgi:hypothetical protein
MHTSLENTGVDLSSGGNKWFPNRVPHFGQVSLLSTCFGTYIPFFLPFMGRDYNHLHHDTQTG